jgi:hypothetical protein
VATFQGLLHPRKNIGTDPALLLLLVPLGRLLGLEVVVPLVNTALGLLVLLVVLVLVVVILVTLLALAQTMTAMMFALVEQPVVPPLLWASWAYSGEPTRAATRLSTDCPWLRAVV